ncbi:MAG: dehydrogenase, partial [Verrucomicrobiota bacterium]
ALFLFVFCASGFGQEVSSTGGLTDEQRINITLEALSRLQHVDLEKNPALKTAVDKILTKTRGMPQFVMVVKQLQLQNQNEGLLEVAKNFPANESGVEAMRMILANNGSDLLEKSLRGSDSVKIAEALGNTGSKDALPILLPILTDATRDLSLRKQAVLSAAQTPEGARKLLDLAKEEKLPQDLKLTASAELNKVRWEKTKEEAAKILPLPQSHGATPLPGVAELLKMKGDLAKGEQVFFRQESACGSCHLIKEKGMEIGPTLTEIGSKLGKEALLESILDPSGGISFGFEANQVELKSGDEAYGLVVSETGDELVMKDLKGIVARYKKTEVAKRQQLKTSIMPAGLQQTMSAQELVDLVEFLSSLRKPAQ